MLEILQTHHRLSGRTCADRLGRRRADRPAVRGPARRSRDPGVAERGQVRRLPAAARLQTAALDARPTTRPRPPSSGLRAARRAGPGGRGRRRGPGQDPRGSCRSGCRDAVGALEETLDFTLAGRTGATPASRTVLTLAAAIRDRRRVTLRYRSWKGEETEARPGRPRPGLPLRTLVRHRTRPPFRRDPHLPHRPDRLGHGGRGDLRHPRRLRPGPACRLITGPSPLHAHRRGSSSTSRSPKPPPRPAVHRHTHRDSGRDPDDHARRIPRRCRHHARRPGPPLHHRRPARTTRRRPPPRRVASRTIAGPG